MSTEIECAIPDCEEEYDPRETGFVCPECNAPTKPEIKEDILENDDGGPEADQDTQNNQTEFTCGDCGEEIPEDANLCPYCGNELDDSGDNEPEIECPEPDCDGTIPQGGTFCIKCGFERGSDASSDDTEDEDLDDTDVIEDQVTVNFDVEGEEYTVITNGKVTTEKKEGLPENSFGMEGRKAAAKAGIDADKANTIHRDHLLLEVDDGTPIVEDNGRNPTAYNDESLSAGDRRELSDGDEIELSGVASIKVDVVNN